MWPSAKSLIQSFEANSAPDISDHMKGDIKEVATASQGQVSRFPFIFVMKYSWHIQIPKDENRVSWEGQRTRVKLGAVNVFLTLSNATLQDVNDATLRVTHTAQGSSLMLTWRTRHSTKCICGNWKLYLSNLQIVFVRIGKYSPNCTILGCTTTLTQLWKSH